MLLSQLQGLTAGINVSSRLDEFILMLFSLRNILPIT